MIFVEILYNIQLYNLLQLLIDNIYLLFCIRYLLQFDVYFFESIYT